MAMTLRLSPEHDRALTLLAQAQGCSKQEAAQRAILAQAARLVTDAEIDRIAAETIPRFDARMAALRSRIRRTQA